MALLVKDSEDFPLGQNLTIMAQHVVESLLRSPYHTNACLSCYQALLLNQPKVTFAQPSTLNLASMLPDSEGESLMTVWT